jgi:hypothetical protein
LLKYFKLEQGGGICYPGAEFPGKDEVGSPALMIEMDACTDFPVQKLDVSTGASKNNNGICLAQSISQGKLLSSDVVCEPRNNRHQGQDADADPDNILARFLHAY